MLSYTLQNEPHGATIPTEVTLAADDIGRLEPVNLMDIPKITRPVDAGTPKPNLEPIRRQAIDRVVETIRKSIGKNAGVTFRPPRKR